MVAGMATGQPPQERNEFLDYLKGLLIILVAWGHVIQYVVYRGRDFWDDPLFKLIYIFHMPLFMAVSGYVYFASIRRTGLMPAVIRRFRQLVVPIIVWTVLHRLLLRSGLLVSGRESPADWLLNLAGDVGKELKYGLWFLWAVFAASVLVMLLKAVRLDRLLAFAMVSVAVLFIPDWGNLHLFQATLPFFFLGYVWAANQDRSWFSAKPNRLWLGVGLLASAAVWWTWRSEYYPYSPGVGVSPGSLRIYAWRVGSGIIVSLTFLLFACRFHRPARWPVLARLGRNSLGIYLLQMYFFLGWPPVALPGDPRLLAPVLGLPAAVVICLGLDRITRFLSDRKLTATYLLGRIPSATNHSRKPAAIN
jgi:fucose 4-O-acetylase-like acetyltransferase